MIPDNTFRWSIEAAWISFVVYWLVMAFSVKRVEKKESRSSRAAYTAIVAVAVLLFKYDLDWTPLLWRFVPDTRAWILAGVLLTYAGVALAIWARTILGGNWSSSVTVKQDHTLIRSGPYATVRHPIYSGILLAGLGTAMVIGEMHCLLGVAIGLVGFRAKSRVEEGFMIGQFGKEYEDYRQHTRALIPFVL